MLAMPLHGIGVCVVAVVETLQPWISLMQTGFRERAQSPAGGASSAKDRRHAAANRPAARSAPMTNQATGNWARPAMCTSENCKIVPLRLWNLNGANRAGSVPRKSLCRARRVEIPVVKDHQPFKTNVQRRPHRPLPVRLSPRGFFGASHKLDMCDTPVCDDANAGAAILARQRNLAGVIHSASQTATYRPTWLGLVWQAHMIMKFPVFCIETRRGTDRRAKSFRAGFAVASGLRLTSMSQ